MKFRIVGADKNSAQEVELIVDVAGAAAAAEYAADRNILVSQITAVTSGTTPTTASRPGILPHISKINFISLCGALILFALPWTDIQCAGRQLATQSGLQTIYGGLTLSENMQAVQQESKNTKTGKDPETIKDIGYAPLVGAALVVLTIAVLLSGFALLKKKPTSIAPGVLAAVVLILINVQSLIGFPVNQSIRQANAQDQPQSKEDREMAAAMGAMADIRAIRTSWFYFENILLGITLVLTGYAESQRKTASPDV